MSARPVGAEDSSFGVAFPRRFRERISRNNSLPPLQHLQPATRVQFGLGAVLLHSNTPSLRVAGFEDDDEDEYEYEAPCEGETRFD